MRENKQPRIAVRESRIHGQGVYATRRIPKGTRIIEYTGERITNEEGAERYDDDSPDFSVTLLFTVDDDFVLDAAHGGNESRYINHSCTPNCEAVEEEGRIFIDSLKTIQPGTELTYDYRLQRPGCEINEIMEKYPCYCGTRNCRGTMLLLEDD